jgi:hypothetical protein
MLRWLMVGVLIAVVIAVMLGMPDIKRYLRMRRM